MSGISTIGVWGDSILKGVVLDENVSRYRLTSNGAVRAFAQLFDIDVRNHAHFGCTAPKGQILLDRMLRDGFRADMVLLEFGGNDCNYDWADISRNPDEGHQPNTCLEEFIASMKHMIQALLAYGIRPVLMTLPPLDSTRFFDWITRPDNVDPDRIMAFLTEKEHIYRHQERYSRAIESLRFEYGLQMVDVRDAFLVMKNLGDYLCADGMHPNEEGQRIIENVFSARYLQYSTANS
jgi:acyl-CoA thioesterase-1